MRAIVVAVLVLSVPGVVVAEEPDLAWVARLVQDSGAEAELARAAAEKARGEAEKAREAERAGREAERGRAEAVRDGAAREREAREAAREAAEHERDMYEAAREALEEGRYEEATREFAEVEALAGRRADGALYWRAYAMARRGRRGEALKALEELRTKHPQSRWLGDAKGLELELRQKSGTAPAPESIEDEELKLMAIDGLLQSEPEEATPLLTKLLQGSASLEVKRRALFVLAHSGGAEGQKAVAQIARGQGSPALQEEAIQMLATQGSDESRKVLAEIYQQPGLDRDVKRAVLQGFMIAQDRTRLLAAAKGEKDPEMQVEAIQLLGALGGRGDLLTLYAPEANAEVKQAVLQGLMIAGDAASLVKIARTEKDPALRRDAVQLLSVMKAPEAKAFLREILLEGAAQ